jgi:hypothetical protein
MCKLERSTGSFVASVASSIGIAGTAPRLVRDAGNSVTTCRHYFCNPIRRRSPVSQAWTPAKKSSNGVQRAPLDPEVARRVDERAARITEQVRRTHGVIDDEIFQTLLADDES